MLRPIYKNISSFKDIFLEWRKSRQLEDELSLSSMESILFYSMNWCAEGKFSNLLMKDLFISFDISHCTKSKKNLKFRVHELYTALSGTKLRFGHTYKTSKTRSD